MRPKYCENLKTSLNVKFTDSYKKKRNKRKNNPKKEFSQTYESSFLH